MSYSNYLEKMDRLIELLKQETCQRQPVFYPEIRRRPPGVPSFLY